MPVQETDVPYAPYNKGDKLGKSADWTSNYHRNQFQSACSLSRVIHRTPCTSFDRREMVAEELSFCDARPNAPTHARKLKRKRKRRPLQPGRRQLGLCVRPHRGRRELYAGRQLQQDQGLALLTQHPLHSRSPWWRCACLLVRSLALSLLRSSHIALSLSRSLSLSLIGQIATSASTQGTTAAGLRGEGTLRNAQARLVVAARATTSIVDMAAYVRLFARLPRRKRRRRLTKASVGVCVCVLVCSMATRSEPSRRRSKCSPSGPWSRSSR